MQQALYFFGVHRLRDEAWMSKEAFVAPLASAGLAAAKGAGKALGIGGLMTTAFIAPGAVGAAQRVGNQAMKPMGAVRPNLHSPVVNSNPMGSLF